MLEIVALTASGTDGEKSIIDGFQRNSSYAIFLRCFIHYKRNIEEHLKKCGFSAKSKQLFLEEIFGKLIRVGEGGGQDSNIFLKKVDGDTYFAYAGLKSR